MDDIRDFFKEVSKQASIVDVISYELGSNALVKSGKDYLCLCPFHNDHKPSMRIRVQQNSFKCFVDGKGGDPIRFVEEYEHIKPMEALKKVCQICSIPLPDFINNHKQFVPKIEVEYKRQLEALSELNRFYQTMLLSNEGKECRDYLEKRCIPKEAISHFQLGFAPKDSTKAIEALRSLGYSVPELESAGILTNSSELSDRFSFRLTYPIEDDFGHLVGFSARKIKEEQTGGKYINYPSTPLFNKSTILYHYAKAKQVAKRYGYIYVVEGFNDVIAFVRAGIESVVGTMGTALTEENLSSLKKLGVEVRLCLDRDEPGQIAMEECLPLLLKANIPFRVIRPFKGGKDADEVLANFKESGNEELNKEAMRFFDPFQFLLARTLKAKGKQSKLTDPYDISEFIKKAKPYFFSLDPIAKIKDLDSLCKITDLPISDLKQLLGDGTTSDDFKKEQKKEPEWKEERNSYTKFNRDFHRQLPQPVNLVNQDNLPQSFKLATDIFDFIKQAWNSKEGKSINKQLIKNEAQIIYVLPHSRKAYYDFQGAHFDIVFKPFFAIALMCDIIYSLDPNKQSFLNQDYEILKEHLKDYTKRHEELIEADSNEDSDDNFAFDVSDIDLSFETEDVEKDPYDSIYQINISEEDLPFLQMALEFISRADDNVYTEDNLKKELTIHPLLIQYNEREQYCFLNNIPLESDSKLFQLKVKLKKYGCKI